MGAWKRRRLLRVESMVSGVGGGGLVERRDI